ncbi:MAG: hypothetical protein ACTHJ8_02975 [Mucilaginibacter sp.]
MTEDEEEFHTYYSLLQRGLVISQMSALEKSIENYICHYLSKDETKQVEILELLLDRMTFDGKRTTFEAILKKNNSQPDYKKKYKAMIEDIRKLIVKRNHFAHYIFNDEDAIDGNKHDSVGLIEYRNSTNTIWYSQDDVTKIVNDAFSIMEKIHAMVEEL